MLKGKRGESLLYIEFKYSISAINNHRKALAQTILTNKSQKNYIMPFTADELGCGRNDLNVLFPSGDANLFTEKKEKPFDFREFVSQFDFSTEAKALYDAALKVFHYYHCSELYQEKD